MDKFDKKKFKTGLLFAAAVILIYAIIMNFHRVDGFISAVYSVISPLLFGVVLALILGTPMAKFEQFFHFLNRKSKSKKKLPEKAITMISLILTYLLAAGAITFVIGALCSTIFDGVKRLLDRKILTRGGAIDLQEACRCKQSRRFSAYDPARISASPQTRE